MSIYIANLSEQYWKAIKWILRYLKGTKVVDLCYRKGSQTLQEFINADLHGNTDTGSMIGYVYTIDRTIVS